MCLFFGDMPKDSRYKTVKILIEGGHVKTFAEIFQHIPPSVVSNDFGTNYTRFVKLIDNPSDFKLRELYTLASHFQVDSKIMLDLAYNQEKKVKRK
jgi:hypothetical protein